MPGQPAEVRILPGLVSTEHRDATRALAIHAIGGRVELGKDHIVLDTVVVDETDLDNVTVVRYNDRLKATDEKLLELMDRYARISINDSNLWATMALPHARHLDNMLELARVITLGALNRNESRGAHYKPEFPERDDANWLRTTIAEYSGEGPVFSYEAVDISLIPPRKRDYSHEKKETAKA